MLSCVFEIFLSVFGNFTHKVVQTWFVFHETQHITLFGIYYWVEMVIIKKIVIFFKLRAKLRFLGFLKRFGHFLSKSGWNFVCLPRNSARITILLFLLGWKFRIKKQVICLKLRAKLRFWCFSSVFELGLFATIIGTRSYLVYFILWKSLESKIWSYAWNYVLRFF